MTASTKSCMSGYEYWKKTFFLADGTPRYYDHKTLPIDIQCSSQAIDTLVFFHDRDPESCAIGGKGRAMDDQKHAGPHRLLLLPAIFALDRQQDPHAALGSSDDALLPSRDSTNCSSLKEILTVKKKVLIIVENLPVPFDHGSNKEARSLHEAGYQVTVLSPGGRGIQAGHEFIDGVHIYRHPMPEEGNSALGYLWEYTLALFWEFCYAWWIYLGTDFISFKGVTLPTTSSWSRCRSSC